MYFAPSIIKVKTMFPRKLQEMGNTTGETKYSNKRE